MGRRRMTTAQLKASGKSHKTKQELAQRQKQEQAWRTGWPIECTDIIKADPVALAQFDRIMPYLTAIGANDELFGNQVRRYCTTTSELADHWAYIKKLRQEANRADPRKAEQIDRHVDKLERFALKLCRELSEFENEYGMTVMSSMRFETPAEPARDELAEILGW